MRQQKTHSHKHLASVALQQTPVVHIRCHHVTSGWATNMLKPIYHTANSEIRFLIRNFTARNGKTEDKHYNICEVYDLNVMSAFTLLLKHNLSSNSLNGRNLSILHTVLTLSRVSITSSVTWNCFSAASSSTLPKKWKHRLQCDFHHRRQHSTSKVAKTRWALRQMFLYTCKICRKEEQGMKYLIKKLIF